MRVLLVGFLITPWPVTGAALDEAIQIVEAVSPEVQALQAEARAVSSQTSWSSKLRFGYNHQETDSLSSDPSGGYAKFEVEIPLFSKKRQIESAQVRYKVSAKRENIRNAFLADVAKLRELDADRAEAQEMESFYKDRLTYFKKAVDDGLVEADTLWSDAEKARKAEHDARQGSTRLDAALEETARRYGAHEWKRLRDLLVAHVKQSR